MPLPRHGDFVVTIVRRNYRTLLQNHGKCSTLQGSPYFSTRINNCIGGCPECLTVSVRRLALSESHTGCKEYFCDRTPRNDSTCVQVLWKQIGDFEHSECITLAALVTACCASVRHAPNALRYPDMNGPVNLEPSFTEYISTLL